MVEFEEENCNVKEVVVKKKSNGISKRGNKWRARARDPKLRTDIHLGYYSTPEEAALAVKMKKLEFEEMYKDEDFRGRVKGENPKLKCHPSLGSYKTCEEAAVVAERKRAEFRGLEETGGVKVPRGVRRIKSGKWVARITDPVARTRIWVGTYDTVDEAVRSLNKRKDLLVAKMTRAEFDGSEVRDVDNPGYKTNDGSVKFECEQQGYDSPSSLLGAENFNNVADSNDARCGVLDSPPTSVFDVGSSNSASATDKTCGLDFDRAVGLGFIDEYGQLQGEFSKFDDPMWCADDVDRIASGNY